MRMLLDLMMAAGSDDQFHLNPKGVFFCELTEHLRAGQAVLPRADRASRGGQPGRFRDPSEIDKDGPPPRRRSGRT